MSQSKPKKILLLNYEFPPIGGGAGNATYYLLKEFSKKKNIRIDLVTSSTDSFREQRFSENIKIYFLDINKKGDLHSQSMKDLLVYSWKAFWFAKKLKKKKRYDLVHAFFSVPCGFIAMLLGLPFVVSLRGSDVPFYSRKYMLLDIFIFQWLNKIIWKKADRVIANSSDLKELAERTYSKKEIEIIPNGINIKEFKPGKKQSKYEGKIGVISTSRLIPRKGVILLLEAFNNLAQKFDNIQLILVGSGNQKESLRNFVNVNGLRKRVVFRGVVSHEEMVQEYDNSDVFVLPSFNEGMSNSLLEALACGLAIVATDTGGARDLVDDDNGLIIGKGSVKEIEGALELIFENKEKLTLMKASSRKKALDMNWDKVADKYLKVYKDI